VTLFCLSRLSLAALALALLAAFAQGQTASARGPLPGTLRVYVGTYTGKESRGIYLLELDPASGALTPRGLAGELDNPSFLALHPDRPFLYAVSEVEQLGGQKTGAVAAFAIDPGTGKLRELGRRASGGTGPCHVVVDRRGKNVLVANYGGGSVAVLPVREDGHLKEASAVIRHTGSGPHPGRQEGPHAHSINLDAANRFALVADLGLDKVLVYRFDAGRGTLTPNVPPAASVPPGSGPRHLAFHPDGRHVYVINELSSTVTACGYDPEHGVLKEVQTVSTLPEGFKGENTTAEVQVHPSGKFLYGSNRGHDSIAVFAIDAGTGRLRPAGHESTRGKTPRSFGVDPTGTYLLAANQDSDSVVVFRIDPVTGQLRSTGSTARVPAPVCVQFVAAGR
jgi:6-phosphogluconolactonase